MDTQPKISIIITCFNYGKYVATAINSALAQNGVSFEIIVVDDGSIDDSWEVISSYGSKLNSFRTENRGSIPACLYGVSKSSGEFLMFLDADDVLYPHAVSSISRYLTDEVSKVQFALDPIGPDGKIIGLSFPSLNDSEGSDQFRRDIQRRGYYVIPPTSGNIWRRSLYEGLGDISYDFGIDGVAYLLAPYRGQVISINTALGQYRLHGTNLSGAGSVNAQRLRRDAHVFEKRLRHLTSLLNHHNLDGSETEIHSRYLYTLQREFMADVLDQKSISFSQVRRILKRAKQEVSPIQFISILLFITSLWTLPNKMARSIINARINPMAYPYLRSIIRRTKRIIS
ncbi:glycosyltransferase family 2 protein [Methylobacterium sp. A49B]